MARTFIQAGFSNRQNNSYFLSSETFCKILFLLWKRPLSETVITLLHTEARKNFGYFTLDSGLLIKYEKYAQLISLWNVSNLFKKLSRSLEGFRSRSMTTTNFSSHKPLDKYLPHKQMSIPRKRPPWTGCQWPFISVTFLSVSNITQVSHETPLLETLD